MRRQIALVLDLLLADLAPARINGGIVGGGRKRVEHVARAYLRPEGRVLGVVEAVRVLHRVQVIEIAEELVEAVHRGQELVAIAEVVLAELAGGVAQRLERGGDGRRLGRQADGGAGLADGGHAGADRQLAGDEIRAAGRAARLGVVVGEQHALSGDLVEVRRPARHHAAVVGADVPDADVVTHDDDDVGLLLRCSGGDEPHQCEQHRAQSYDMLPQESWFASMILPFRSIVLPSGQPCPRRDSLTGVWCIPPLPVLQGFPWER